MASKTLSNGTLSLRFMQNAQRAKLQAQVQAEQAKVVDDAEWSVSQEVKDAWGIRQSSSTQEDSVHESSYLPFIFQPAGEGPSSSSQSDDMPEFRGRRTFNARGKEVVTKELKPKEEGEEDEREPKPEPDGEDTNPRSRFDVRPTSISGFRAPISTQRDGRRPRTKTAQMLIREDVSVRLPPPLFQEPPELKPLPMPLNASFVKPAGVDEPVPPPRKAAAESRKCDREQDPNTDRPGSEGKKRKKKKEATSS